MQLLFSFRRFSGIVLFSVFLISSFAKKGIAQTYDQLEFNNILNCQNISNKDCILIIDSLTQTLSDSFLLAMLYEEKGDLFVSMSDRESAIESYIIASRLFINLDSINNYVNLKTKEAYAYIDMGDFVNSEKVALNTKRFLQENHDDNFVAKSFISNCLGNLYYSFSRHEEALIERKKCLEYRLKYCGEKSIKVATALSNIAQSYQSLEQSEQAEELMLKGHKILKELLHEDDETFLNDIYVLGVFYYHEYEFEKALNYFTQVVDALERLNMTRSRDYHYALNGMCSSLSNLGHFEEAYATALLNPALREETLIHSPIYIDVVLNLGNQCRKMSDSIRAYQHYKEGLKALIAGLKYNTEILTQEELSHFISKVHLQTFVVTKFFRDFPGANEDLPQLIYDLLLLQKGLGLEREAGIKKTLNQSNRILYNQWLDKKIELNNNYQTSDSLKRVTLNAEIKSLNKQLLLDGAGKEINPNWVSSEDIQSAISANDLAIEFDRIYTEEGWEYVAYVLNKETVHFEYLFKESEIENLFKDQTRESHYVNMIYAPLDRGFVINENESVNLYKLILEPLLPHLEGKTKVYYSMTDLMHRINLGAISIGDEEVLLDKYELHQLGSTRGIVNVEKIEGSVEKMILIGGLEYETADKLDYQSNRSENSGNWANLSNTEKEIIEIELLSEAANVNVQTFKELDMTEADFARVVSTNSLDILHIATHGFFLEADPNSINKFQQIEDPMMRSGLVLSNGNQFWTSRDIASSEDNILTAAEICDLNLEGLNLVVLSACETALGDIKNSQGVFGLQRAFKVAGANYLIMALWKIPDRQTRSFMTTFYKYYLNEGMSVRDSFIRTQRDMKARFFDPYAWAGFILIQ